jgi:hypothetical protein
MNYIGVRGHRGAGKSSVAYLLGHTLNFINNEGKDSLESELFDSLYKLWCYELMNNPNCINESNINDVYFESFSDSIKTFIRLLLGCPEEYLYEDKYKDIIAVNLRNLSCIDLSKQPMQSEIFITATQMHQSINHNLPPQPINTNTYMTLREFIMYFGLEVMQRYFGVNVWVKSLKANTEIYDNFYDTGNCYKIFIDLKTPAEVTYIKQNEGIIVNVNRPSNKKGKSGLERLGRDNRIDYNIEVKSNLYELKDEIINISKNIIEGFKNGKNKEC